MFREVAYVGDDEALGLLAHAQMAAALPCSAVSALQPQKTCHQSPAPRCRAHRCSCGKGAAPGSSAWATPSQSKHEKQQRQVSISQVVAVCLYGTSCKGTEVTSLQHTCLLSPCPLQHHAGRGMVQTLPGALLSPCVRGKSRGLA